MIVSITGHRPIRLGVYNIPSPKYDNIVSNLGEQLIYINAHKVIVGMCIGVDMWAAELCIKFNIPYVAAVPFIGQESKWNKEDRDKYNDLLLEANEVVVVNDGGYSNYKFQKRNEWMVDNSDCLLAVFDGKPSGTYNCVSYAKNINKKIIIIKP